MSVSVKNVTKLYGTQKALDDVSFEIIPGEIVGFLGPNGAGKSTMMKIISCFLPQSIGDVKVCGFDVLESPLDIKKNVGYLPEHNPLYLDMYVKEYLAFVGGLYKIPNVKTKVDEMIEIVGLQVEQKKKIGALSKGYRQRVGLAQALLHEPKVLILDEPTTGLDPNQIVEIRNVIKQVGKEKTVMMSTHIMQEVEAVCDRVIIINQGKIVADDKAENLKKFETGKFMVLVEFDKQVDITAFKQMPSVEQMIHNGGNSYKVVSTADIRKELFNKAVELNLEIVALQKQEQKLEDIFREMTSKSS